jgi:fibro-slime domain-containing protein
MTLSFSGNDDVWVFVDNHLAMDLGGLHDKASGSIDFSTGEISVNGAMQDSSLWSKLGVSGRFADGSSHTVSLFYLNRGATGSNAAINFNIPIDSVAASDSSPTEDGLSSGDPGVRKKTAVDSTSASNPDPGTSDSGTSNSGNQSDSSGDQPTGTAKTGATSTATSAASGTTTSAAPAAASICVSEMVLGTDHPHRSSDNVESLANPFQYKLTYQGYMNPDPNNPGGYTNLGGDPGTVAVANGAQAATVGTDGQLVDGVAVNAELASGDALWTVIPSTLTNGVASEPSSFGTFTFTKAGRYTFVIQHDPVSGYNMESSTVWDRSANTYTVYADVSAGASGALQASVSYIPGSTGDEDGDGDADTADALAARIVSIEGLYDATAVENLKKILSGDSIESFNDWSAAVYLTAYHGDGVVMPTKVSHTNCNCLATPVGETISSLPLTGAAVTYNEILGVGGGIFLAAAVAYAVVVLRNKLGTRRHQHGKKVSQPIAKER